MRAILLKQDVLTFSPTWFHSVAGVVGRGAIFLCQWDEDNWKPVSCSDALCQGLALSPEVVSILQRPQVYRYADRPPALCVAGSSLWAHPTEERQGEARPGCCLSMVLGLSLCLLPAGHTGFTHPSARLGTVGIMGKQLWMFTKN